MVTGRWKHDKVIQHGQIPELVAFKFIILVANAKSTPERIKWIGERIMIDDSDPSSMIILLHHPCD